MTILGHQGDWRMADVDSKRQCDRKGRTRLCLQWPLRHCQLGRSGTWARRHVRMVRYRFVTGHRDCELRQHLSPGYAYHVETAVTRDTDVGVETTVGLIGGTAVLYTLYHPKHWLNPISSQMDWTTLVCFSCGRSGHGMTRCPQMDETFPFLARDDRSRKETVHVWDAITWCNKFSSTSLLLNIINNKATRSPEISQKEMVHEGSIARISNSRRPPDPGCGALTTDSCPRMTVWTLPPQGLGDHRWKPDEETFPPLSQETLDQSVRPPVAHRLDHPTIRPPVDITFPPSYWKPVDLCVRPSVSHRTTRPLDEPVWGAGPTGAAGATGGTGVMLTSHRQRRSKENCVAEVAPSAVAEVASWAVAEAASSGDIARAESLADPTGYDLSREKMDCGSDVCVRDNCAEAAPLAGRTERVSAGVVPSVT